MEITDNLNIIFWVFMPLIIWTVSQCLIKQGIEVNKNLWIDFDKNPNDHWNIYVWEAVLNELNKMPLIDDPELERILMKQATY